ncbi:hypothetical protein GMJAKD_16940 [Candidatus Electrothrix aarhusensis]
MERKVNRLSGGVAKPGSNLDLFSQKSWSGVQQLHIQHAHNPGQDLAQPGFQSTASPYILRIITVQLYSVRPADVDSPLVMKFL